MPSPTDVLPSPTSPMPSPIAATHGDIRSEEQEFKRSRDHAKKYKYFNKGGNTPIQYGGQFSRELPIDEETGGIITCFNGFGLETHPYNNQNKGIISKPGYFGVRGSSSARVAAAYLAKRACIEHEPGNLDSVPALDFVTAASAPTSGDEGVLYSFDREASPARSLEFVGLVEKAEAHFRARETERIVRGEYEVLDAEGETVRGKRRGRKSPKVEVVGGEVDGEWEAI